jgi:peptide chain release factor 2
MKQIRTLNSWIKSYDQVVSAIGDLQVLFEFYKEGEASEEDADKQLSAIPRC